MFFFHSNGIGVKLEVGERELGEKRRKFRSELVIEIARPRLPERLVELSVDMQSVSATIQLGFASISSVIPTNAATSGQRVSVIGSNFGLMGFFDSPYVAIGSSVCLSVTMASASSMSSGGTCVCEIRDCHEGLQVWHVMRDCHEGLQVRHVSFPRHDV